ncbi:MAG: PLP-dependent aminotransferase family protein [candidate division KSB1 bacterium]|nr:PLP-dependent aminotransferase family protein [candidate division KSB1 bacterium]
MEEKFAELYSEHIKQMKASAIREICKLIAKPEIISLAGGWPDPATFPVEEAREILADILEKQWRYALQYGTTEGLPEFREFIAQWAKQHEHIDITADQILLTTGSTQGMDLAGKTLINPGDLICAELPTYFLGAFTIYGAKVIGIPIDDHGIQTDQFEQKLKELYRNGQRIKLLYIQPNFQNPTGATLALDRRHQVIQLANEYNFMIVEDNPYGDINFEAQSLPALKALDRSERVIYLRSFSKVFSPGIRLAWAAGEAQVIRKMAIAKQYIDACSCTLSQYLMYEFCKRGYLEQQIQKNISFYQAKRDFMLQALERYFPESVQWNRPKGGFFIFVRLPDYMDAGEILEEAVANNVAFISGAPFYIDGSGCNTMRLSYAQSSNHEIEQAIKVIGQIIKKRLKS